MIYFTADFEKFFAELKTNNNKEWFDANKSRYEKNVKKPFHNFITDVILRMQHFDPQCRIEAKDAIFRINRDIRFSADKTPYKTQVSAIIGRSGRKGMSEEGMYLELSEAHVRVYGGMYMPDKDQLAAIRQEILYNPEEFQKAIEDKKFKKWFGEIRGEKNKRLPAEFAEIQDKQPLIANKQFYYFSELDPSLLYSEKLIDTIFEAYQASQGVREFLFAAFKD